MLLAGGSHAPQNASAQAGDGIHKIRHVVIIMQENRSFDSYFGTYPGADGIPMANGKPTVCVPNPAGGCTRPFHDATDLNGGGPHGHQHALADIDGGKMDGFMLEARRARANCANPDNPSCGHGDVMGYHDEHELANYWRYARDFVLQDRLFEPNASWSLPQHLYMVSEWSAKCSRIGDPMSCVDEVQSPDRPRDFGRRRAAALQPRRPDYAWTDLTYLLHKNHVSWGYYVMGGTEPDCANDAADCPPRRQQARTPGIWNPLPAFDTVKADGELRNIRDLRNFYTAAKNGTLPSVVWICPAGKYSEHPPGLVSAGQAYVTGLVNAIAQGPNWDSTAIFLTWDDWGGGVTPAGAGHPLSELIARKVSHGQAAATTTSGAREIRALDDTTEGRDHPRGSQGTDLGSRSGSQVWIHAGRVSQVGRRVRARRSRCTEGQSQRS